MHVYVLILQFVCVCVCVCICMELYSYLYLIAWKQFKDVNLRPETLISPEENVVKCIKIYN